MMLRISASFGRGSSSVSSSAVASVVRMSSFGFWRRSSARIRKVLLHLQTGAQHLALLFRRDGALDAADGEVARFLKVAHSEALGGTPIWSAITAIGSSSANWLVKSTFPSSMKPSMRSVTISRT